MPEEIRPLTLASFTGQPKVVIALSNIIGAAKARQEPTRHVLLYGPPGLGKTTLAIVIANEVGGELVRTVGAALRTVKDMADLLLNIKPYMVLFIDEIHSIQSLKLFELLYTAMEDRKIDISLGDSTTRILVRWPIPPFTVVGATTRLAKVPQPLRDRFGLSNTLTLEFYDEETLASILTIDAGKLDIDAGQDAISEIARRGRGTPRIAIDLLLSVRDYAQSLGLEINQTVVSDALLSLGIDHRGLNNNDRNYMKALLERFNGNPAGVEAIASVMNLEVSTLESVIEPWLLRLGFIDRTPRGRVLTDIGKAHLGL